MSETEQPRLEAPGAGLPVIQEYLLRHLLFPVLKCRVSRARALAWFEQEGQLILGLVRAVPATERTRRVLVPRLMGIEDSSRYWSLDMALDHMVIVSQAVLDGVITLSRGQPIGFKVDTAKVKPRVDTPADIDARFEALVRGARDYVWENAGDLNARECHEHPWFGCLTPHGWLVMMAVHAWVHRRQVVAIARGLQRSGV
jgi:hypothetical protein